MNCKQGDLAIVVKSELGNEGKVVRCIRVLSKKESDALMYWSGPLWEVDAPLKASFGFVVTYTNHCPDSYLRPLRNQDGEDEMLRISGKPEQLTA